MDVVGPGLHRDLQDDLHDGLHDDVASADEHDPGSGDLNLRPRTGDHGGTGPVVHGRRPGGARKWPWLLVLVGIAGAIGFVIFHAINDATLYYLNADEAVARQGELADKHFRLQGTVVKDSVQKQAGGTAFAVAYNGVEVEVFSTGDPPQLFQPCIPVVLDGQWQGSGTDAIFQSSTIIVAHDSTYEAENSERIKQAEQQAKDNGGEQSGACLLDEMNAEAR